MNKATERHYAIERRLADTLRHASRAERLSLYRTLYDELYREVPSLKTNPSTVDPSHIRATVRTLKRFLGQDKTFLEIGAGNLAVSRAISPLVKSVIALDVSIEFATALGPVPQNVKLIISDGLSVPVADNSVDLAYSSQLMEHLHPNDAEEQLKNIYHSLKNGGVYICNTPHRFNGPHDISQYFDETATGFHLKEYTNRELAQLFKKAGFRKVYSLTGAKGFVVRFPLGILISLEAIIERLPHAWRRPISRFLPVKILLGIRFVGQK